jgi:hypothetical protein
MIASFVNSVIATVLLGAFGQVDADKEKKAASSIAGVYHLYVAEAPAGRPIAKMAITLRGKGFSVRGLDQPWSGEGRVDGANGFYNWIFEDGNSGKTTFTLHADGTLRGHVVGSGLNWKYVARKSIVSAQIAADPRGYIVAMREHDGEDGFIVLYESVSGQLRRRLPDRLSNSEIVAFSPDGDRLVTVGRDANDRTWNVNLGAAARGKKPGGDADLERAWAELAGADASAAYEALLAMASDSERAVALVRKHLQPATRLDAAELDRIIADLDSEKFATRQKANDALDKLGRPAAVALQHRLAKVTSLELKRRLTTFIDRYGVATLLPNELRAIRSLELLEHLGTPAAQGAIAELTKGEPTADLTIRAVAAKARLDRRR